MKVYFSQVDKNRPHGVVFSDHQIAFKSCKPTLIQPSEIMKVPVNVIIKVAQGAILNLSTHPKLSERVGELFPALLTLDASNTLKPLELAIKNYGRNPINLFAEDFIAVGHLYLTESVEPEEFSIGHTNEEENSANQPQKKNPDIRFEIR